MCGRTKVILTLMLKFITSNKQKFKEVRELLKPIKVEQLNIDLDEIQDIDPHKIIRHKLKEAFKHHKGPFIVEDGSVVMEALGGKLPGPLIKWFNDYLGAKGTWLIAKKMGNNKATASIVLAYAKNSKDIKFFEGKIKGRIVSPKGSYLFGYDPIFLPNGGKLTLSQLKSKGDFTKSPRGIAVAKLKKFLISNAKS